MAAKKRVDPIKQREKRAKIAAGIGCLLFLVVGAIEVPSMMKMLNQKPPPGANATDAGNRNPDGSIPLPSVATSSGLSSNGELANTDVPPAPDGSQLVAFSVFQTKNPFTPQGIVPVLPPNTPGTPAPSGGTSTTPTTSITPTTTTPTTTTPTTTTPTTTTPTTTTPGSVVPGSAAPPTGTSPTTTTAAPSTVTISVNGVVSHIGLQGTFPTGSPVFRLVSYTADSAQIGIVGGSYASGGATLTLQLGKSLTLQNTTDQKTYKLELVATH
jgi:hypothetical protein